MSKGHGRVERLILEALKWKRGNRGMLCLGATAKTLACYVRVGKVYNSVADPYRTIEHRDGEIVRGHHPPPTRSELESVRRALRNLRKQGLVLPPTKYRHVIYEAPGKKPRVPD
jgi:hypothetical protein